MWAFGDMILETLHVGCVGVVTFYHQFSLTIVSTLFLLVGLFVCYVLVKAAAVRLNPDVSKGRLAVSS